MGKGKKRYGWRPSLPDHRDHVFCVAKPISLPPAYNLLKYAPPVYDQGDTNSCTGNASAGAAHLVRNKEGRPLRATPSRLMIYYGARAIEGSATVDEGATIRDVMKSMSKWGFCDETLWPFNPGIVTKQPSPAAYKAGEPEKLVQYLSVKQNLHDLKAALVSDSPVVLGISIYDSFESDAVAKTGIVPLPQHSESLLGGHAVLLVGYDDASQRWLLRNSWGPNWGQKGYFTLPYAYLLDPNLADDFWILKFVP